MADLPLIQERYAPDQFRVLVTCIFLNKTRGVDAEPYIESFFEEYPTPESVAAANPEDVLRHYFQPLGKHRRAWWVINMAKKFLIDPPQPFRLRYKTGDFDSHLSEVAHLPGIGEYASDAWRLFCRRHFYSTHGVRVSEEWDRLNPKDRVLNRYVQRRRREESVANSSAASEALASQLGSLQLSGKGSPSLRDGIIVGSGRHKMFVPRRLFRDAESLGNP